MRFLKQFALAISLAIISLTLMSTPHVIRAADISWPAANGKLAVNDISWLFPMPATGADLANEISLSAVSGPVDAITLAPSPAWSDSAMKQYFGLVPRFSKVHGTNFSVALPARLMDRSVWYIAGVRLDPGAPGLSDDVHAQFGQQPQIRLIVQPVFKNDDGTVQVLDIAAHLIFSYSSGREDAAEAECFRRPVADMAKLSAIAEDAVALKLKLASGGIGGTKIRTDGTLLGVHPALKSKATAAGFRGEVLAFLNRHLPEGRLTSMAVAGIPGDLEQPFMFLAMGEKSDKPGEFNPVPGPALNPDDLGAGEFGQMLSFINGGTIEPVPAPNNLNPVTCRHSAMKPPLPAEGRKGLATAELFAGNAKPERIKEIVSLIGDVKRSHFFNTDCLSCHTDTRLGLGVPGISFPGIDDAVLPRERYNVRNFGWFPGSGATATNRTLQETIESVDYFNEHVLGK